MSIHSDQYLHDNIMVGGVMGLEDGKGWRKPAWWFDPAMEDPEKPSHYPDMLPVSLVKSRLFGWEPLDGAVSLTVEIRVPGDHPLSKTPGKEEIRQVTFNVPEWKGVIREDKLVECYLQDQMDLAAETVMNVASKNFATDSFKKVLIDATAEILQGADNLAVTGAGVLKWGKIGYIEVSIPETLHDSKSGIDFRPNLLGSTSFDSSVATRWDRTITNVVCDNTHAYALSQSSDKTGRFIVKRTKNFSMNLAGGREALGILTQQADEFTRFLHECIETPVSEKQFIKWLDIIVPIPEVKTTQKEVMMSIQGEQQVVKVEKTNTNSQSIALNKRDALESMYHNDERVAPWAGTKWGVAQLANTWYTHESTMKGAKAHKGNVLQARVEGNQLRVLDGTLAKHDARFIEAIDEVLRNFDPEGVTIPLASDKPVTAAAKRASRTSQNASAN